MFPLSLLQSSHSPVYVYRQPELPHWTTTLLILRQLEDDMLSVSSDMERRMQHPHQAHQLLANEPDIRKGRADQSGHPAAPQDKFPTEGKDGKENFELSLDVSPFSPEELTVRTEGRRLIVAGKSDKKREMENGGFFQEYKEWRREAELPEDVNPEDVLCSMSKDGRLHFWAHCLALPAAKDRTITITMEQSPGEGQGSNPENQNHREQQEQDHPRIYPEGMMGVMESHHHGAEPRRRPGGQPREPEPAGSAGAIPPQNSARGHDGSDGEPSPL